MYCHFWSRLRNDRRVENLNAEPGAHQRADERATPAEQARAAEDDGGDRGEGVPGPLSRVTDSELRKQDDRAEQGQERGAEVAEERRPVDGHADPPRRLLVRPDRAQPHAGPRLSQRELEAEGAHDEHDERERHRADLRGDERR